MRPNAGARIAPHPEKLRRLVDKAGLTGPQAAALIGVKPRTMYNYLTGATVCPYPVLFCLESLAKGED